VEGLDYARRLPRGRHRLSRAQVVASQRGRMLEAMARAVAEQGYAGTSVADVLSRAGVSRETFYEQFRDKEECFLAAYGACVDQLLETMVGAAGNGAEAPLKRFDRALKAYLEMMAGEGTLARVFLIEVYGAGPAATARRVEVFERFVDTVAEIFEPLEPERFECEALVAAVSSLVTIRVSSGRLDEMPGLRAPILELAGRLMPAAARRGLATG
jgi:AcrR family transcriptional regulator